MTKSMIRKALSVAAASSLAVFGVVGVSAPAYAANELKLEPASGTVYGAPSTDAFVLKASFKSGYSSSGVQDQLKFYVTAVGSNAGAFIINGESNATEANVDQITEVSGSASNEILAAGDDLDVSFDSVNDSVSFLGLAISAATTSTTYQVKVQAYVDSDEDDAVDSDEWSSEERTITFLKFSDIDMTADIQDPTRGDGSARIFLTSSEINVDQLKADSSTSQVGVKFFDGSTKVGDVNAIYDSTKKRLSATTTAAAYTALAGGDSVKTEVYLVPEENASGTANSVVTGTDVVKVLTRTESVGSVNANGAPTKVATTANGFAGATSGNAATLRSGDGSFTVSSEVTFASGKTAGSMKFEIQEQGANTIQSDTTITAGGSTLTNSNAGDQEEFDVTVAVTKDAGVSTGDAELEIAYTNLDAGDKFTVVGTIDGYTAAKLTLTAADATPSDISNINAIGVNDESSQIVFPVDQAISLEYVVIDQFGALWTAAGASVTVSDGTKSNTANVVNGYATVSMSKYTSATTKTFTPTLKKDGTDVNITEPTMSVAIAEAQTPASVTVTGDRGTASTSPAVLNLKAQKNADTRAGAGSVSTTNTASNDVVLSGQVDDTNGAGIPAEVTFSGTGIMFEHDGVYSLGSITVLTQSDGSYDNVVAFSNTAGKTVITATSGAATKTEEIWFAQAIDDTASSLTVSAPAYAQAGSTFSVTVTLTDKFGNPIDTNGTNTIADTGADFKITYTGPGLIVGTLPTQTDSSGQAKFSVLLGANDTEDITVTASYDYNDDLDYADDLDLNTTATIKNGVEPAVQKVNAGSFKGYVAVYAKGYEGQRLSAKIGNDWVIVDPIVNNQGADLHRTVDFTGAGVDIAVRIYIDRELIDTINLTTK